MVAVSAGASRLRALPRPCQIVQFKCVQLVERSCLKEEILKRDYDGFEFTKCIKIRVYYDKSNVFVFTTSS